MVQEKYSASEFVDKKIIDIVPAKPPPVESSPYKLVEEVKDLKELAAKLKSVNEFAVILARCDISKSMSFLNQHNILTLFPSI